MIYDSQQNWMLRYDYNRVPQILQKQRAKGKKVEIVPGYITKYVYREGEGNYADLGHYVVTSLSCRLMSGKEVYNKPEVKLLLGRKRLIRGLEIGLLRCRKNEKLILIIASDYAYGQFTIQDVIPANSKLIFQLDIKDIFKLPIHQRRDVDKYVQVHHIFNKVDHNIKHNKYQKAIAKLQLCLSILKLMARGESLLRVVVVTKWVHILLQQKKYDEAVEKNRQLQKLESNKPQMYLNELKIKRQMGQLKSAKEMMQKFYNTFSYDKESKRKYIEYLKQIKDYLSLRQLDGYNYAKDKITSVKSQQSLMSMFLKPFPQW